MKNSKTPLWASRPLSLLFLSLSSASLAGCSADAGDEETTSQEALTVSDDLGGYTDKRLRCLGAGSATNTIDRAGESSRVRGTVVVRNGGAGSLEIESPVISFAPTAGRLDLSLTESSLVQRYLTADIGFMLYIRRVGTSGDWTRFEIPGEGLRPRAVVFQVLQVSERGGGVRFSGFPENTTSVSFTAMAEATKVATLSRSYVAPFDRTSLSDLEVLVVPMPFYTNFKSLEGSYPFELTIGGCATCEPIRGAAACPTL